MDSDRRVHARGEGGSGRLYEVVRYDRASTWHIEWHFDSEPAPRSRRTTLGGAVDMAQHIARASGEVFFDLPGGSRFDKATEDYRPGAGRQ